MLEKLIEELGGILYGLYNLIPKVPKGRLIEEAITRIGKAYAEGMKLPGEVAPRFQVSALSDKVNTMEGVGRHIKWVADAMGEGADIFIALRKKEE